MSMNAQAEQAVEAGPPADRAKKPRHRLAGWILALVLVGAAGYGLYWWTVGRFVEETDDAYVGADVTVIAPKVAGNIAQLQVRDNQLVHAGDTLLRLDDRDFRAALAKAEGAVAAQQALLANLDATSALQRAQIDQAQAGLAASTAENERASADEARYRDLVGQGAVSQQSNERALAEFRQARANQQKAGAALLASQRELDVIATRKRQAAAALTQAMAEREQARLNLSYTVLKAPLDGVVGNRRAHIGSYAGVGSQLLTLVPAQGLWIDANFKEDQLARFRPGQRATVRADILPGRVFHGRVASLSPATGAQFSVLPAENATGNFTKIVQRVPVRIVLDGADASLGLLRPGLSVTVAVDLLADGGQ
ncbi:MAG: HlyD family secretion protein [Paludibacterium sp.]|uniref:HlyD family secretion protein n=1 Tax=Paludibacterium sp. TaxID=1917523 RepID=UPI0025DE9221|nr:HlyD family secretion protein [Paludibacterium sp.]MBV8047911.1 HlyD family secretion protein [Paludibacterium sp.]